MTSLVSRSVAIFICLLSAILIAGLLVGLLGLGDFSQFVFLPRVDPVLQRVIFAQLLVSLLALLLWSIFMRRHVVSVLLRLSRHVHGVKMQGDFGKSLGVRRRDELGVLAAEIELLVRRFQEDVGRRDNLEQQLREEEERYAAAVKATGDGLWDWDVRSNRVYFSARLRGLLGHKERAIWLTPAEWLEMVHPDDRNLLTTTLQSFMASKAPAVSFEHRIRRADNEYLWTLCRGAAVLNEAGEVIRIIGLIADISVQKHKEEQLAKEAMHDALTGLPNRSLLLRHLELAKNRAKRGKYKFSLLFLDLDRFKVINDGLGHLVGDELLKQVSEKIHTSVRATDTVGRCSSTVARLGGDEFVVLLDDVYDVMDAIHVAERIQSSIAQPFNILGSEIYTSTSIGIAMGGSDTASGEEIIRNADTALYRAKAAGKACYAVFDSEMGAMAKKRLRLETDLRRALEREELLLHYQPIVDLRTGTIDSFEVLVRWVHPEFGAVSPDEFIRIAEETDAIQAMGRWIVRAAARQTRDWQRQFPHADRLGVNINLAAKEFGRDDVVARILEDLEAASLAPEYCKIEVTEGILTRDVKNAAERLSELAAAGVRLAIDDFGTGYASLSHLSRLSVQAVKIDLSFVREMHVSPESLQLVTSILSLSQSMNLKVIAEGVEEKHQLTRLRELACDYGQGYLFSPPLDVEAATRLIAANPRW